MKRLGSVNIGGVVVKPGDKVQFRVSGYVYHDNEYEENEVVGIRDESGYNSYNGNNFSNYRESYTIDFKNEVVFGPWKGAQTKNLSVNRVRDLVIMI